MSSFKIIAIRTGKKREFSRNDSYDFLKNLAPETIFPFYSLFSFPHGNFDEIIYDQEKEIDLFNLDNFEPERHRRIKPTINVNAVVGVNGSGKSTLIELLYLGIYNIGCRLKLLETKEGTLCAPNDFLDFEILYTLDRNVYFNLKFKGANVVKQHYSVSGNIIRRFNKPTTIRHIRDLQRLFYTVVINYSHYALNTAEMGEWLHPLFHKNDGYQTPIVLNPLRERGQIDINKEIYLLGRRLQANILEPAHRGYEERSLRNLGHGKMANSLRLKFNPGEYAEQTRRDTRNEILVALKQYYKVNITRKQLDESMFINVTLKYIEQKLVKIAYGYRPYFKYRNPETKHIKDTPKFLQELRTTDSHITFKIKGAILYIKYFQKIFGRKTISFKTPITLDIDKLSRTIAHIASKERFLVNTFMMAPPRFFETEIVLGNVGKMSFLSSGEKQRIHSISSIVYHLINLNSVERQKKRRGEHYMSYDSINIVLDEIELYYHPEWQRRYVADLLDYINNIGWRNIIHIKSINITFLTHSPYILSDIPIINVLRLDKGRPITNAHYEQTFGANIHELLAKEFFMHKGFLGEWAKRHIENVIKILNKALENNNRKRQYHLTTDDRAYVIKIIDLVGEPIIKNKLLQMLATIDGPEQQKRLAKERITAIAKNAGISISF